MKRILRNRFQCKNCEDIIESKSVHDFVRCSCGNIFTDGGHEYIRLGLAQGLTTEDYVNMCEWEDSRPYSEEAKTLYKDVNRRIFPDEFPSLEEIFG